MVCQTASRIVCGLFFRGGVASPSACVRDVCTRCMHRRGLPVGETNFRFVQEGWPGRASSCSPSNDGRFHPVHVHFFSFFWFPIISLNCMQRMTDESETFAAAGSLVDNTTLTESRFEGQRGNGPTSVSVTCCLG